MERKMNNLIYKELSIDDLKDDLLDNFSRYQKINNYWIKNNDGIWILMNRNDSNNRYKNADNIYDDDWDKNEKVKIINNQLRDSIVNGGFVVGVYLNNKLIAFANLPNGLFGENNEYIRLTMLHVSNEYRNMGIGKELFKICVEKAKTTGAKKLYISAHFSEETQSFYKKIGCVDAIYVCNDISEYHPGDDRQLEFIV
jgi:ribosomal protein S18 acetylase RimI-like enzyme